MNERMHSLGPSLVHEEVKDQCLVIFFRLSSYIQMGNYSIVYEAGNIKNMHSLNRRVKKGKHLENGIERRMKANCKRVEMIYNEEK